MKLSIVDPICPNLTVNHQLLDYIVLKSNMKNCPIFRYNTIIVLGTSLNNLTPLPNVMKLLQNSNFGDDNTRDFDIAYANQLCSYQPSFIDIMQIMGSLQFSEETFLLCDIKHPNSINIIDSLMKFLQERYSINLFMIQDLIDIDNTKTTDFQSEEGYQQFISDLDKYKTQYFTSKQLENEVIV